jgi:hypothetical protein
MTEIKIPYVRDTKNYWVSELKNGIYIITVYLPKSEYETNPKNITVNIDG